MSASPRSKSIATWLALTLGSLGAHRVYLHGWGDRWAWLHPWPTLLGFLGVYRINTALPMNSAAMAPNTGSQRVGCSGWFKRAAQRSSGVRP